MFIRPQAASGVPIYLQLMQQVRYAVDTGALQAGDQLPTIRALAEQLVINPNTVARAYRELEHSGLVELRHGAGAFIARIVGAEERADRIQAAQARVRELVEELEDEGLNEGEIRRLFEAELARGVGPGHIRLLT
jgi:GntR family transcriptional regulator